MENILRHYFFDEFDDVSRWADENLPRPGYGQQRFAERCWPKAVDMNPYVGMHISAALVGRGHK